MHVFDSRLPLYTASRLARSAESRENHVGAQSCGASLLGDGNLSDAKAFPATTLDASPTGLLSTGSGNAGGLLLCFNVSSLIGLYHGAFEYN